VPIVHLSVRWWRSLHQAPARLVGIPDLAPSMGLTLVIGLIAFTLVYLYLVLLRLRLGRLEERRLRHAIAPGPASAPDPSLEEALSGG
jgi:heme exporter protein C